MEAFDETVDRIREEYEDGDMMNLGAEGGLQAETISTGSIGLDKALQVGGVPKGRITEVYGKPGVGKCLAKDTFIDTDHGLETIEELYERNGVTPSCTNKITENTNNTSVTNKNGNLEKVGEFVNNGKRKIYRVKTESGSEIKCTANHPFLVINKRGNWVWKKAINLDTKDYVVQQRGHENFGSKYIPKEKAYLIGVILADGHMADNHIGITNDDPSVKNKIKKNGNNLLGCDYNEYPNNKDGSVQFRFNCKDKIWDNFYNKFVYSPGVAKDKGLSKYIRQLDKDSLKQVIKGYIDCESYINSERNNLSISSASKELLQQLKLTLQKFGIISRLSSKDVKGYKQNDYYRLHLPSKSANLYKNKIGSESKRVKNKLSKITTSNNYDTIPNINNLIKDLRDISETSREHNKLISKIVQGRREPTYNHLDKILNLDWNENSVLLNRLRKIHRANYHYDRVKSVEEVGEEPTFDLHMPKTHSMVTNGIVTHNTTLALHILANAQKNSDNPSVLIDAEHALDTNYAETIGLNTEQTYISQPNSGEKALSIVQMICEGGGADVIVVDSVAALTPEAELKGEMGESQVGVQARLMSQAMRKLRGVVRKRDTALIFINQMRANINTNNPFGPQSTTTGGKALRYYSTIRIKLWYAGKIEYRNNEIGNTVGAEVAKNKLGPPHHKTEFDLIYGEGIDRNRELIDIGKDEGVIKIAGSWYKYEPEEGEAVTLGQGKQDAANSLEEDKELRREIESKILEE